jgi:hypothetical protein
MNNKKVLVAGLLLLVTTITLQVACASFAPSAQFEVTSLDIKPTEVTVGETANISARVTNTGGTGGVYYATLSVDGEKIVTKDIAMDPGSTQSVTFSLSRDKAGSYEIAVGKRSAMLTVTSKLVARPVEIGYDDGVARDYLSLVKPATGYLVRFVSPPDPFTVNNVRLLGLVYGSPGFHITDSNLQIWDKDKKVLYSTPFTGDGFPLVTRLGDNTGATASWADIEMPNLKVAGDFYVHIYTGIPSGQGFRLGADDSGINTRSGVTVRSENGADNLATEWPYKPIYWYGDSARVNWMVRVAGNAMVPQE